jgi:hypothetical protein
LKGKEDELQNITGNKYGFYGLKLYYLPGTSFVLFQRLFLYVLATSKP